jgi:hypothetical protein
MRPELAEPIRDHEKLRRLLPLAEQIYALHEAGGPYLEQLRQVSLISGRIVDIPMVLYAFGAHRSECFARRLLIDWHDLPRDLSKHEMLELLEAICTGKGSEDRIEYWLKCLTVNTGDQSLSDLIYWPNYYRNGEYGGRDLSPAEMLDIALAHGSRSDA